jgi:hypothetical protein
MKITGIIWLREVVDKLAWKHQVTTEEVDEAMAGPLHAAFVSLSWGMWKVKTCTPR